MWLNLDLEGIKFYLRIKNYTLSKPTDDYDNWCRVDLAIQSKEWLNYQITNHEILMSCEVEELLSALENLLINNEVSGKYNFEFTEPDVTFTLYPKQDVRNHPDCAYVRPGYEIVDIGLELQIHFWNNGLTAHYITLTFNREEIEILVDYLKLITNRISIHDKSICNLINKGSVSKDF